MKKNVIGLQLIFQFLVFFNVLTGTAFATEKQLGILVQVKNKKVLNSKEFKDLVVKNNLSEDRYYPSLKIQSYKLKKKDGNNLRPLCEIIIKSYPDVSSCEINFTLTPQSASSSNVSMRDKQDDCKAISLLDSNFEKTITQILNTTDPTECDLFGKNNPAYQNLGISEKLSPFWAQEYTGADLLKEEMEKERIDTSNAVNLLEIWDSRIEKHGEAVANLIAGQYPSSLIRLSQNKEIVNLNDTQDLLSAHVKTLKKLEDCKGIAGCTRYINNSMSWAKSEKVSQAISDLNQKKIVFVTSAGNDNFEVEQVKRDSSAAGESIIVASSAPNGLSSNSTHYAKEVDISAPSDISLLSYNHNGFPMIFRGTSGAAPQVTSALLAFELIAGVQLTTREYKDLLKKTAIRHKFDPERQVTGAGYLNSYKIGAIAFKLKNICKQTDKSVRDQCMREALKKEALYKFPKSNTEKTDFLGRFKSAFPECGQGETFGQSSSCEHKKNVLKELRKAAFLESENLEYWEMLRCVHEQEGLTRNAEHYARLASGERISVEEIGSLSIPNADIIEVLSSYRIPVDNVNFFRSTVMQFPQAVKYLPEKLIENENFIFELVKESMSVLLSLEKYKKNHAFNLRILKEDPSNFRFIDVDLQQDKFFISQAIAQDSRVLAYVPEEFRNNNTGSVQTNVRGILTGVVFGEDPKKVCKIYCEIDGVKKQLSAPTRKQCTTDNGACLNCGSADPLIRAQCPGN